MYMCDALKMYPSSTNNTTIPASLVRAQWLVQLWQSETELNDLQQHCQLLTSWPWILWILKCKAVPACCSTCIPASSSKGCLRDVWGISRLWSSKQRDSCNMLQQWSARRCWTPPNWQAQQIQATYKLGWAKEHGHPPRHFVSACFWCYGLLGLKVFRRPECAIY